MSKYRIEGILTAVAPIHQGGDEKTGSTPILRTIPLYLESLDQIIAFPYISGNSVRNSNRRRLVKEFFDILGYECKHKKVHHIFNSGGGGYESTEGASGTIDLEFRRMIYKWILPLALLGCSIGNQGIEGNLIVEHMWPICEEYSFYAPSSSVYQKNPRAKMSVREFIGGAFLTRRDDLRTERTEGEQAVQMKVDYEAFGIGTQFYHAWALKIKNNLHASCLARLIELWKEEPFIGSRSAGGDGKLKLQYEMNDTGDEYLQFVRDNKEQILGVIYEIEKRV